MTAPLVITMGEPAGIGTELTAQIWRDAHAEVPPFILIDDADRVTGRLADAKIDCSVIPVADLTEGQHMFKRGLPVVQVRPAVRGVAPGSPSQDNAAAVVGAIDQAVDWVKTGAARGLVTNPIHKQVLKASGFSHPGHTEYLAHLAGNVDTVMMLLSGDLRVVPVTVHVPLKDVSATLTTDAIVSKARITADALTTQFGIVSPRLAVLGLNPHAGDGGAIGTEEQTIIAPAVARLIDEGIEAAGPLPADTVFHADARQAYDAIICMYHDQALIPLKTVDFWNGVNVTLGLPFVRTSPDHGTAFELAGSGKGNPASLKAAILQADHLSRVRSAP